MDGALISSGCKPGGDSQAAVAKLGAARLSPNHADLGRHFCSPLLVLLGVLASWQVEVSVVTLCCRNRCGEVHNCRSSTGYCDFAFSPAD